MKSFIIGIIVTLSVFGVNKYYLSRIEKLEQQIRFEKNKLKFAEKSLEKSIAKYNSKSDLKKIELEMMAREDMQHSEEIVYFKLEGEEKVSDED